MELSEARKEDELYLQGAFWIKGDSVVDILSGNFSLITQKLLVDYNGNYVDLKQSKNSLSHLRLWNDTYKIDGLEYNYYPRGRVSIYNGIAFIHIHSLFNTPKIIDKVIQEYKLNKLEIRVESNDITQGSHYDFLLK